MAEQPEYKVESGEGYAVAADAAALGTGPGIHKVRHAVEVTAFGVNLITLPPGYQTNTHFHDEQEELYFVHKGEVEMTFGDGTTHLLREGGCARVDASAHRSVRNPSETEEATYLCAGGKDGYIGRDGQSVAPPPPWEPPPGYSPGA